MQPQEGSQAAALQRMFLPADIATGKDTGQIFKEPTNGEMELQRDSEIGKTQQSHAEEENRQQHQSLQSFHVFDSCTPELPKDALVLGKALYCININKQQSYLCLP